MRLFQRVHISILILLIILALVFPAHVSRADVPVRISVKFILDVNGNRPSVGNLNTDTEIWNEINQGVSILREVITEFSIDTIEFVDLAGVSQWYSTSATSGGRDAIRNAAIADPATYRWRTDVINIYINGGSGSAISDFPPTNNMILMNQWCGNTPSCTLHELGHSLNLMHTHESCCTNQDECADTLTDDASWTKDQISQANFGKNFAELTPAQQDQVNMTYNNVMSYHTDESQRRLSPCQMNRVSSQGYNDRNWLLTKIPIYVDEDLSFLLCPFSNGSFVLPYCNVQNALNAGGLTNRVLVLQQGSYTVNLNTTINDNVEIVTRSGPSSITAPGVQLYKLPVDLEKSENPRVKAAAKAVQDEDSNARKAIKDAEEAARSAASPEERAAIMTEARGKSNVHLNNAINRLLEAEGFATGDEKIAVQFELAQRYRDSGDCALAIRYFKLVAEATDQQHLAEEALRQADKCQQTLTPPTQGTVNNE